jgi:hypothetical protein
MEKNTLYNFITREIIAYIEEYKDEMDYFFEELEKYQKTDKYEKIYKFINEDLIQENVYHDDYDIYSIYGSLTLNMYIFCYNKEFYNYLYTMLIKNDTAECLKLAEYIKILLDSNYEQSNIIKNINLLLNNKTVKISYIDNYNNIVEKNITDIEFDLRKYYHKNMILAKCNNEKIYIKLNSILTVENI